MLFPPYIKFIVWAVFVLSGIGLLLMYVLPQKPPVPSRPAEPPTFPAEVMVIKGTVKDFGANHNGDIDQLLLGSTEQNAWLRFPPHTARQVMQFAPKGTMIAAIVHMGPPHGPAGNLPRYQLEKIQAGDAVLPLENIPPPPPAAGKPVELNGNVDSLVIGDHGEVMSLIVNNYRIALPPHLARSLEPLLQQGKPVLIKGYERSSKEGFVNTDQHTLIKPFRMTIDSTDYLL